MAEFIFKKFDDVSMIIVIIIFNIKTYKQDHEEMLMKYNKEDTCVDYQMCPTPAKNFEQI